MDVYEFNDFELLYLIRKGNEDALDIIFKKYEKMIAIKIYKFKIYQELKEDFMQEGRILLAKAIKLFDQDNDNTFYAYFTCILDRKFNNLIRDRKNYAKRIELRLSHENYPELGNDMFSEIAKLEFLYNFQKCINTPLQQLIFDEIILKEMPINEFCTKHNLSMRKVYNATYVLRRKCFKSKNDIM